MTTKRPANQPTQSLIVSISNQYQIDRSQILGHGSTGQVYLGREVQTDRQVAIKMIRLETIDNEVTQYLLRMEKQALMSLKHDNVLRGLKIVQNAAKCYMVTQYLKGGTLKQQIRKNGKLSEEQSLQIVKGILKGYSALVKKGIVHRDLKPANIMLTEQGKPKIIDFGYCEIQGEEKPSLEYNVGSPSYMAPESFQSNVYNEKTQIWAIGIILYECLMGKTFDEGRHMSEIFKVIKKYGIPFGKDMSSKCRNIIKLCLQFNPNKRPSTLELISILMSATQQTSLQVKDLARKKTSSLYSLSNSTESDFQSTAGLIKKRQSIEAAKGQVGAGLCEGGAQGIGTSAATSAQLTCRQQKFNKPQEKINSKKVAEQMIYQNQYQQQYRRQSQPINLKKQFQYNSVTSQPNPQPQPQTQPQPQPQPQFRQVSLNVQGGSTTSSSTKYRPTVVMKRNQQPTQKKNTQFIRSRGSSSSSASRKENIGQNIERDRVGSMQSSTSPPSHQQQNKIDQVMNQYGISLKTGTGSHGISKTQKKPSTTAAYNTNTLNLGGSPSHQQQVEDGYHHRRSSAYISSLNSPKLANDKPVLSYTAVSSKYNTINPNGGHAFNKGGYIPSNKYLKQATIDALLIQNSQNNQQPHQFYTDRKNPTPSVNPQSLRRQRINSSKTAGLGITGDSNKNNNNYLKPLTVEPPTYQAHSQLDSRQSPSAQQQATSSSYTHRPQSSVQSSGKESSTNNINNYVGNHKRTGHVQIPANIQQQPQPSSQSSHHQHFVFLNGKEHRKTYQTYQQKLFAHNNNQQQQLDNNNRIKSGSIHDLHGLLSAKEQVSLNNSNNMNNNYNRMATQHYDTNRVMYR